ncbi:MAG: 5-formyltetrahydrofolate cyclo-ligase [Planctomycetes bacterium]|nr:5-formyltetrahydrofolate cyclo-ligase [Planctomycetota bacterium]
MEKAQAREHIRRAVTALSAAGRAEKSRRISDALLKLPEFAGAKVVMLFASMADEADTLPIIRAALEAGKTVVLPKVLQQTREMIACPITNVDDDMHAGGYGILEPTSNTPADVGTIDFCLVPARAFDRLGGRLGRGAGYYDRFMADPAFRAVRCGIAFGEQILETVPSQPHDLPVHVILTDTEVIRPAVQR